ncbi:hypothetical protein [Methylobacterium gossipiicola]|uniref:Uncharacterized protein n=1 Tax=Methylobacterium gossipiicola TaxID=582675 RepID=A0A1I2SMC8_9HYPH|nr:hypothetical protein [Methylobacterium gossipiicola]SFG53852.1 hypothetical protein SAMN05192565_10563 [Methylobacterium gossipiicola]
MLALLVSNLPAPVDEPVDRDPGIITLAGTVLRAIGRERNAAFRRRCDLAGTTIITR